MSVMFMWGITVSRKIVLSNFAETRTKQLGFLPNRMEVSAKGWKLFLYLWCQFKYGNEKMVFEIHRFQFLISEKHVME